MPQFHGAYSQITLSFLPDGRKPPIEYIVIRFIILLYETRASQEHVRNTKNARAVKQDLEWFCLVAKIHHLK